MKKWIHQPDLGLLVLRVFIGLTMTLSHGLGKVPPSEKLIERVVELGFPLPVIFAWSAGLAELVGGVLIALGLYTRFASSFVAFTMIVAAFGVHANDPFQKQELSLVYLACCILFMLSGAGSLSLDRFLRKK